MSTSRSEHFARRWLLKWAIAGLATVCGALPAFAVDPNRTVSQYLREAWGNEKGFPGGVVSSFAQTPDGYLWIGTDKGLIRFDGLTFRKFEQASPSSFPIGSVRKLLTDAEGNLWILLQNTKLLRYRDGAFELSRGEAENGITAMGETKGGAVLLSSLAMGTLTYSDNRFVGIPTREATASIGNAKPDDLSTRLSWSTGLTPHRVVLPNYVVTSMIEAGDGKVWLGTEEGGLFYLSDGRISTVANRLPSTRINCLLSLENSALWVGTSTGFLRWDGTKLDHGGVPPSLLHVGILSMIRDRDANIWVGTTRGVERLNNRGGVSYLLRNASPNFAVTALFEDREGNIWIGDSRGVERLRDSAFVSYSFPALKLQSVGPVYPSQEKRIWFAPIEGGLQRLQEGDIRNFAPAGLAQDVVYSIGGLGNDLWLGRQRGGLTHLRSIDGSFVPKTYTQADGLAQNSVLAVYESRDGTLWSGTLNGGVSELRNDHFTSYTTANGLASNTVSTIAEGTDGTMWFGTPNGVSALSKSGWRTYGVGDGLVSQDVNCLLLDSTGILWIGTAEGLALLNGDHIQVPRNVPDSLHEQIYGIAEDKNEWLWIATASHILQVKRESLLADALSETDVREYGIADGLLGTEGVKRYQSVVTDSQGRIWFSTNRGLSVADPGRVTLNSAPALVHIEAVLADGSSLNLRKPIQVPGAKQRTTFRYVALSLGDSERVRYRYRLDGFDHDWSEPVKQQEATYANLGAGPYRFRVIASNSDGLWNSSEAVVAFEVAPRLWQTWWFRLAGVAWVGLITLMAYRLRMHQLTRLLNVRFEERLAERTRIAQELHDTLLQGVLSVSMQLHVTVDQLPDDSPVRQKLNRILQLTGQIVEEGRNMLRGLRSPIESAHDLKNSLSRVPEELGHQGVDFRVVVEGISLPLRPAIRDDVYSIGREALVNAFRHSGANNIEVYLDYAANQLRVLVQDDGAGIDPRILHFGRDGHWGLSGMRERAERIGAELRVMSRSGGGTEVELRLPSDIAFESNSLSRASKWFTIFGWKQKRS